jgi:MFS family permease
MTALKMKLASIVPDKVATPAKFFLVAGVFNGFGNGIFNVVTQLWLITLGFKSLDIGSIMMTNPLGAILFTLPAGILADRYGKRKIIILGFLFSTPGFLIILTSTSFEMLSLAWFLVGLGNGTGAVFGPLYSSFFDAKDMDRAFGLQGFLSIMASSMGSLMGFIPSLLVERYGFSLQSSYFVMRALGTMFLFVAFPFFIMSLRGLTEPEIRKGVRFNLRSKSVVAKFSLLYTIQNIAFGFFGLFPYYVNTKFGVKSDALGALYSASTFVQAGANIVAPRVSKRIGTLKTISVALRLYTPFWFMFAFAPDFTWLSAVYISRLSISSLCNPLLPSLFFRLLYQDEKATANSITNMASTGSNIVGPRLAGYLMQDVSLDAPPLLGTGLYALYSASFYLLLRNEKEKTS